MANRLLSLPFLLAGACLLASGCAAIPDRLLKAEYHNPFPQMHRVAILPFYNQSDEPTVSGDDVALAYYNELQTIPGFEIVPVGVVKRRLQALPMEPRTGAEFQKFAQDLGADAVIVGSITEYSPYYPPRIGLAVNWYAANPGFHPIPAGYGLPWGTAEEEFIPNDLVREAEFALAREQLATQVPAAESEPQTAGASAGMPPGWPDARGFTPPQPTPARPPLRIQHDPIIKHVRVYHGADSEFTQRLEQYFYFRDDARFGGWQGYLQRPADFVRFCCHLHVTETLAARGGAGESQVVWRWPLGRYER